MNCPECDTPITFDKDNDTIICSKCKLTIFSCPGCSKPIHPERIKLGFNTCIDCSTTKKYGFVRVFEGKNADKIEIVKDVELAAKVQKLQSRRHGQI